MPSDVPFFVGMVGISLIYLLLIAGTFGSMTSYATLEHISKAMASENVRFAIRLSLITCTISTILSLWVAVPIGYLMSRFEFRGKNVIDTVLDVPIILPPLVVGLGLLILFQTPLGKAIERVTKYYVGDVAVWGLIVGVVGLGLVAAFRTGAALRDGRGQPAGPALMLTAAITIAGVMVATDLLPVIRHYVHARFATRITHAVPAVVLAQFMVACAFAVRTMRVTFDQIHPRQEQVALTLGATRSEAFWMVVLPQARRGMLAAAILAWARSLGEFGPILVFASATPMRTEVLPTTVWLELQTGSLESAAVVSLSMVVVAVFVLVLARVLGLRKSFA